jgi:hypothetical protein
MLKRWAESAGGENGKVFAQIATCFSLFKTTGFFLRSIEDK